MHPYRIAGLVLGAFALLTGGFLVVGLLLPSGWTAERTALISAPPETLFPLVEAAERWGDWTPSPDSGVEIFGPDAGAGSGRRWDDPGYGQGEFVIVESQPPEAIRYAVEVEGGSIRIEGALRIEPTPAGSRVHWREEGHFGWNPLLGYLAGRMDELQGAQMEASLAALQRLAESEVTSLPD